MTTNIRHDISLLSRHTEILKQGATVDQFRASIPFPADHVAIINQTEATLFFIEGEPFSQSPECTPVEPGGYISTRIRETQKMTVFWRSDNPLPNGATVTLAFSNEPIPLQAGNITPNSTTSNVAVTNTATVNVNTLPTIDISTLPAIPAGANAIGSVEVTTLPALPAGGNAIGSVEVSNFPGGDSWVNYSAAEAGAAIKAGAGVLKRVVISDPGSAMVISLYDAASAVNPIAVIVAAFGVLEFNAAFATGLFIVIAGTTVGNVTVCYE